MDGKLVCHTGVIQAPLRKGFKQVHRLVVLPDYQGTGIGTKFITFISQIYAKQDLIMKLITTTPAIRFALDKSENWTLTRSGKVQPAGKTDYMKHWSNSESSNRITYTYLYKESEELDDMEKTSETTLVTFETEKFFDIAALAEKEPELFEELVKDYPITNGTYQFKVG